MANSGFPDLRAALARIKRRRVAVIYGGPSAERAVSLQSAAAVRAALRRWGIPHAAFDLSPRLGGWLLRDKVNLAFLTTHGTMGEDGRLQGLLDVLGIPYTGSGVRASALAMHKPTAKRLFRQAGLTTPPWAVLRPGDDVADGLGGLSLPLVVKPASQGSAVGVTVARSLAAVRAGLRAAWAVDTEALVEAYVPGREITVGLLGDRLLPVVEIVPVHGFYDYHSKYAPGGSRHIVPAPLPGRVLRRSQALAAGAFHALGCRHVARVDLLVDRRDRPTLLEVNTLPGLTSTSLLPDAAKAAGLSFDELMVRLLWLALTDPARE